MEESKIQSKDDSQFKEPYGPPEMPLNRSYEDDRKELMKTVNVRTPRRGRSKSISVSADQFSSNNFPIGRLNNYNNGLKRYKGSLSMISELECISELDQRSEARSIS